MMKEATIFYIGWSLFTVNIFFLTHIWNEFNECYAYRNVKEPIGVYGFRQCI